MTGQLIIYLLFGISLVVLFGIIIKYYYSNKRREVVEAAKYRMLEDDAQDSTLSQDR